MNSSVNPRPSNYSLSRYILGECSDDEKIRIEQWIQHSDETRHQFENYKNSTIKEELSAPSLFIKSPSTRKKTFIFNFTGFRVNFAIPTIAFSIVLCLVLFSLNFLKNTSDKTSANTSDSNKEYSQGFRDSLAFLRKITNQNIRSSSLPECDFSAQSVAFNFDYRSVNECNRADRTGIFKE